VSDEKNVREALDLGAVAHISKPFSQAQLLQIVAEHLPPKL
jgi:CheY-like chemotaxis protein